MASKPYDYLIIGGGIMGLTVARSLRRHKPQASVILIEKEHGIAGHASGRNSGVLHAGFYYTADSLKARFTVEGNRALKNYVREKGLAINECGKLVVAKNEDELEQLFELERRGKKNGSNVRLVSEHEARDIEPNAKTFHRALYSPDTATVDPKEVCRSLKEDLQKEGVEFIFDAKYIARREGGVVTSQGEYLAQKIINCAGLYADRIAHDFGFGKKYTMIPFKGLYLEYVKNKTDIRTNIYPVPNLKNPFLGVHYTKTVSGKIKIGPTATPAFWRENYSGFSRFDALEMIAVGSYEARLFLTNAFGFRDIAFEEMKKYNRKHFIDLACQLVHSIDRNGFGKYMNPGIRAQLLDKTTLTLVQDFVVEGDAASTHLLNAVSPAFTCSFPFSEYIISQFVLKT